MSYVEKLRDETRVVEKQLPHIELHLARSCLAAIIYGAFLQSRLEDEPINKFRRTVKPILEKIRPSVLDAIDSKNSLPGKRQPSLRESFDATLDRFIILEELQSVFGDSVEAIMCGGSMKYGPFMNVRSGADASDLDLIMLTEQDNLNDVDWLGLMDSGLIDPSDKVTFFARCSLQRTLRTEGRIDIMSQRYNVVPYGLSISSHFVPKSVLSMMYPEQLDDIAKSTDSDRYIRDYKERPFERPQVTNFSMTRRQHTIPVYNRAVEGGFIASNPAYSVREGCYIPGMYQNLVLPSASIIFDIVGDASAHLRKFSAMVIEQEQTERLNDERASIANTEPRLPIIPADVNGILSL